MASGRISSRCSARCRSVVRQDRCGRCGSVRQLGPDLLHVLDQEAAEVLPGSARLARSARICSMASGRISSRRSARWRSVVRRNWHGWCGRRGSVRQLQKLKQTGTKKRVFCPWVFGLLVTIIVPLLMLIRAYIIDIVQFALPQMGFIGTLP